jgi:hypothetical protein
VETADGQLIEARDHPRDSFAGHQRETSWGDIHVTYFSSEALWTYLIIVPTQRRVYAYQGDYQIVADPLLVAIDMTKVTFS